MNNNVFIGVLGSLILITLVILVLIESTRVKVITKTKKEYVPVPVRRHPWRRYNSNTIFRTY